MQWRIYYDDGSVFTDKDGSPWCAPRTGVQIIAYEDVDGWGLISQADFYYYEPESCTWGWWHCGPVGMTLHLQRARKPLILFGAMMLNEGFSEVEKRALADVGKLKRRFRRGMDKVDSGVIHHG